MDIAPIAFWASLMLLEQKVRGKQTMGGSRVHDGLLLACLCQCSLHKEILTTRNNTENESNNKLPFNNYILKEPTAPQLHRNQCLELEGGRAIKMDNVQCMWHMVPFSGAFLLGHFLKENTRLMYIRMCTKGQTWCWTRQFR